MNIKKYLPFIIVIGLALLLRLVWLDRIPIGITDDELDHAADAKAIFSTGKDITGKWSPLSLSPPPHTYPKSELTSLVITPLIGPVKLTLFSAHLPFAVAGVVLVGILYLICLQLFDPFFASIIGLVAALNPTGLFFSRTGYESPLALTLYFVALYMILFFKGWKILLSFPFLFLAFYSYIGTKIIFFPFIIIACFYSWFVVNKKKFLRPYIVLIFCSSLILVYFISSIRGRQISRIGELLSPWNPTIVRTVNEERRLSIDSPLIFLFNNKFVALVRFFTEKYLGIFSANFLFLYGEGQQYFSLWKHGMFYYLDFIFLLLGFGYLFSKKRNVWLFLIALISIAPLPSALSMIGTEYAERAILIYPPLIIFIAAGIYFFINLIKGKKYFRFFIICLVFLYFVQFVNFAHIYILRNPIYNSEGAAFSYRVLANYIKLAKSKNKQVYILSDNPLGSVKMYFFYNGGLNKKTITAIRSQLEKKEYVFDNLNFLSKCNDNLLLGNDDVILTPQSFNCPQQENSRYRLSVPQLADGGEVYKIFNDSLCSQFDLGRYPQGIKFSDLKVEELSAKRFCEKYITDMEGYVEYQRKSKAE